MVAGQNDASGFLQGNPAGRFQCLGGFVDEEGRELLADQCPVGTSCQSAGDDTRLVEEILVDGDFQFGGTFFQTGYFLMQGIGTVFLLGIEIADALADGPQLGVVRMAFETPFVGACQHTVGHTHRVADTQHGHTAVSQFLGNPVHGHIALGAHQHLTLAVQGFVDGLHKCGGLSCARRSVNDSHILGPQYLVYGCFLGAVEPRKTQGLKAELLFLTVAVEDFTQIGQPSAGGAHHTVQSFEHQPVGGFVDGQVYTQPPGAL